MIPVTEPYLPPRGRLNHYLDRIHSSRRLTNNGPLVQELTEKLQDYLGVDNLLLVANGTLALQVAYQTLNLTGSAVTTPFTFPATVGALKWTGVDPVYADVGKKTFNIDPGEINKVIKEDTTAMVAVHCYGNPCDVELLSEVANKNHLRLIYDASHCFGVTYFGESILKWGDAATLSFHATKLFSTVEGGAIVFRNKKDLEQARRLINFGMLEDGRLGDFGINAKMSEFHAAFGLACLPDVDEIIDYRLDSIERYKDLLKDLVRFPVIREGTKWNGAYSCIILESEDEALAVKKGLENNGIESRRYFRPLIPDFDKYPLNSVLCLPLVHEMSPACIKSITNSVKKSLRLTRG